MNDKKKAKEELLKDSKEKFKKEALKNIVPQEVDKTLIENPSLDRWLWLLKRTVQDNNWSNLHEGFQRENSYFRELADIIDFVNDEANNVPSIHQVRQSIMGAQNPLYKFRQNFAVDMFNKHTANENDANLVIEMFNRTVTFKEYDEELLLAVRDAFNKRKGNEYPLVNNLNQAFQIDRVEGRPKNPYEVPNNVRQLVVMIIDEDMSRAKSIIKIHEMARDNDLWRTAKDNPRPSIWDDDRWRLEMRKYKWTALNDYLYDRMEEGRTTLSLAEKVRIHKNWNLIDMPTELICYSTYIKFAIDKLNVVKSEVIKAKDLN